MLLIVIQLLVALCAAAAAFFLVAWLVQAVQDQLQGAADEAEKKKKPRRQEEQETPSPLRMVFNRWAKRLAPRLPERFAKVVQRQLVMAGGLKGLSPAQLVLSASLALLGGLSLGVLTVVATRWSLWWIPLLTTAGAVLPFVWLRDQVKRRHLDILADLPFHLDLLTLSVEAGLDFTAGVAKTVEKGRPGALREEFSSFLAELRIGKTRAEAFEAMSERVGLPALSTFLSALIQADRMGSGLGRALRLQAEQLRNERFQRAEKAANEAPVKMLIPLVLFIFPTLWIILFAPLVFDFMFK